MRVVIAGATGFLGRNLTDYFSGKGFEIAALNRREYALNTLHEKIEGCDILINLVGASIAGLWTDKRKRAIYNSRIVTTRALVNAVILCKKPVKAFIQISGVGLYDGDGVHDEYSVQLADNFLKSVIIDWENTLRDLNGKCGRVIILRLGAVLGKNGGILSKLRLLRYVGFGLGVRSDEGFAFIHISDLLGIFNMIIAKPEMEGVYNGVSPEFNSISSFYRLLARTHKFRFTLLVNGSLAKLFLGESIVLVSKGQRVVPLRLQQEGFMYKFPGLEESLVDLLLKK